MKSNMLKAKSESIIYSLNSQMINSPDMKILIPSSLVSLHLLNVVAYFNMVLK